MMTAELPAAIGFTTHGYVVVHAPVFDTKVRPGDVGSVTVTGPDVDGTLLGIFTVYVMF